MARFSKILKTLTAFGLFSACLFAPVLPTATAQTELNACVSLASDSNGFGHVTFQLPDEDAAGAARGTAGIVYIQPIHVIMTRVFAEQGVTLTVKDHSQVAANLTSTGRNSYMGNGFYGALLRDRCKFVVVTPFIPDVAVGKASPEQYRVALSYMLNEIRASAPGATIFALNFYQPKRAKFTENNSGFGLTPERINAFNAEIAASCTSGTISKIAGVRCIATQPFFDGMSEPYTLVSANKAQYEAAFYKRTGFTASINSYFTAKPDGAITGDGIHLSIPGREQFARGVTALIKSS